MSTANDSQPTHIDIQAGIDWATPLFDAIGQLSFDGIGFTRAAYGEGEQMAHDLVAKAARDLGLRVEVDAALNLSMTLCGAAGANAPLIVGSHLDAVPRGGNFDGLAGVLAGLACAAAWQNSGRRPPRDIQILAIRAEESAWFGAQHIGSRALLGTLPVAMLDQAHRVDTGRTLCEHMREAGVNIDRLRRAEPLLDLRSIGGYIELHIEQGPLLVERELPLGIVSAIRGNRRCRRATCAGAYGHSGTMPRVLRHDAVFAVADLVVEMDALWREIEEDEGGDLVLTFGQFSTDAATHSVTSVPGHVTFSFDARSHSQEILDRVERELLAKATAIGRRRGAIFEFAPITGDPPIAMDGRLHAQLLEGCHRLSIPAASLASGAGHDAGDFAAAGIPTAMIFVRNDNGSHNPQESMDIGDFAAGVRLLTWFVGSFDSRQS